MLSSRNVSPIFQPYRSASPRPMMQPRRSVRNASIWSARDLVLRVHRRGSCSASTAKFGKKFVKSGAAGRVGGLLLLLRRQRAAEEDVPRHALDAGHRRDRGSGRRAGRLKTRLTAWRVTSRVALALSEAASRPPPGSSAACRTGRCTPPCARTVLSRADPVPPQVLEDEGRNFIGSAGEHALVEVVAGCGRARPRAGRASPSRSSS